MSNNSMFPKALDAIGRQDFAPALLLHLNAAIGAEHCVLYRFEEDNLQILGSASSNGSPMATANSLRYRKDFWKRDAVFHQLKSNLSGYRSEISCVPAEEVDDAEFRHELFLMQRLAGRAMLVGERDNKLYGISLFRANSVGFFDESERAVIHSVADTLISCVAKHHDLIAGATSLSSLFDSVDELASRFMQMLPQLTARECDVCARIIYGMSMKELARDLSISIDSAVTYRKRAFIRLGVISRAELLRKLLEPLP